MKQERKIIYEPHPVSRERKAELVAQGYRILDAVFAPRGYYEEKNKLLKDGPTIQEFVDAGYLAVNYPPAGYESRSTQEEILAAIEAQQKAGDDSVVQQSAAIDLDTLDAEALHALAKERGVEVHHKSGADKVREALRAAQE